MGATESDAAEARRHTLEGFREIGIVDFTEDDLSYITPELLDAYEDAQSKRNDCKADNSGSRGPGFEDLTVFPCYIGHSPVLRQSPEWAYQNNNSDDGCDRAEHLCGTGYYWRANIYSMKRNRHCPNGFEGMLGWRQGETPD